MSGKEKSVHTPISREDAESLSMGNITISDEVVAVIAAESARKVQGVVVVGSSFRLSEILGTKEPSYKGISVKTDLESGHVEINLDVNVVYGANIYETAARLQRQIVNDVEALTGSMIVDKVNIRVKNTVMSEESAREPMPPDKAMPEGLKLERERHERE